MDLLFKRYASPFPFLDGMIRCGRFNEFVINLVKTVNQEREDTTDWEFFLHKVWEGSFADFRAEMKTNKENMNLSQGTIETTILHSMNILNNFNPDVDGGEN